MDWKRWDEEKPVSGDKIVIACNDGCSTSAALVVDGDNDGDIDVLDAEDGLSLAGVYMRGAIWVKLPDDYALHFMEMPSDK